MKRIIVLFLFVLILSGCEKEISEDKKIATSQDIQTESDKDIASNSTQVPKLSEKDIEILNNIIQKCTVSTAFEDANFEYELYYNEMSESVYLRLIVIKPMQKVLKYYDTDVDGLIQILKNSLTFNMFLELLNESELSYKTFSSLEVRFDDTKDDPYSLKFIDNK